MTGASQRKRTKAANLSKVVKASKNATKQQTPKKNTKLVKPPREATHAVFEQHRKAEEESLRGWLWAAAAAAEEAAAQGVEAIDARGAEAALARPYLAQIHGHWEPPKKLTWASVAKQLWTTLGLARTEEGWIEGEHYNLSPYHLRIVSDPTHYLYDVRGHESTDPNPKDFAALVEGVRAVGWIMQSVWFTVERGQAIVAEGRRRVRAARAYNLRELASCVFEPGDRSSSRAAPPRLIETIPANFTRDPLRVVQVKNGGNYLRSGEDVLRQMAGIQQLEKHMSLVAIAGMMGVHTQTLANIRSLGGLSLKAQETLRAGKIPISLAYRLSRELPDRQDAALAATDALPAKSRQRAIEAFLAGQSPEAEARAFKAKDIKAMGRLVAATKDPELAPLRSLFAVLRGDAGAVADLPPKWREGLGLLEDGEWQSIVCPECYVDPFEGCTDEDGRPKAVCKERIEKAAQDSFIQRLKPPKRQVAIDDGVPEGMRVACPVCQATATEYCLDGDDDDGFGVQDGTRIHRARIVAASRSRMPVLPAIAGPNNAESP